jgi:hypothetical protein
MEAMESGRNGHDLSPEKYHSARARIVETKRESKALIVYDKLDIDDICQCERQTQSTC